MKILYITNGISGSGGLEKVLSLKILAFIESYGYSVEIVTINEAIEAKTFFPFSKKLIKHQLKISGNPILKIFKYVKQIKDVVKKSNPDIIFVADDGLKAFFIPRILNINVPVVYERHASVNISVKKNFISQFLKKIKHFLMKSQVSNFSKFIVLTKGNIKEWGDAKNILVIPNPVERKIKETSLLQEKKIISVGSQGFNKGTDILVNLWSSLEKKFPEWSMEVYGKEHPENIYKKQAEKLGLQKIKFFPATKNIHQKYIESSFLVSTSRSEGFGLVLVEAMSYGLPVVAFDCPTAPADIIKNKTTGFLIQNNDNEGFLQSMELLINDFELRKKMGEQALKASEFYETDNIMKQWNSLILELCNDKKIKSINSNSNK